MKHMTIGKKRYMLVFQCVDPPTPIIVYRTDNLLSALATYQATKDYEKQQYQRSGSLGGEWTLTLYGIRPDTTLRVFADELPDYFPIGEKHVYAAELQNVQVLHRISYMDLPRYVTPDMAEGPSRNNRYME